MRRLGLVLALVLVGGTALADQKFGYLGDKAFADKAAMGGTAEVKLSQLALEKGQSVEVKQFARRMVEDHSKANMELKQLADKKNLAAPAKLDDKHQAIYDRLAKLEGAEFDKEYMRTMAQDHDETVKLFQEQARNGQDPDLKSFAMKTLPIIEKHDDMAHMDEQHLGMMPMTKEKMPER